MSGQVPPRSSPWQERLKDHCRTAQLHPPVFNIVSDRRGGRTAWSSTVTIPTPSHSHSPGSSGTQTLQARYWYDGQYVHNAKEDAAEVAWRTLTSSNAPMSPPLTASSPASPRVGAASPRGGNAGMYGGGMGGGMGYGRLESVGNGGMGGAGGGGGGGSWGSVGQGQGWGGQRKVGGW